MDIMTKKVSNDVLVERIDNLAKDVKEIKDLYLDMASNIRNLQTAFVPRDELSRIESNWKSPIEKLTNTVYGPDGTDGLVLQAEKNKNGIDNIKLELATLKESIKNTATLANNTSVTYGKDKAKLWGAIGILVLLGGGIITLSTMAIKSQIKDGIQQGVNQVILNLNDKPSK